MKHRFGFHRTFWGISRHTLGAKHCQPVHVSGVEESVVLKNSLKMFIFFYMIHDPAEIFWSPCSSLHLIWEGKWKREIIRQLCRSSALFAVEEEIQRNWSHYLIGYIKSVMTVLHSLKAEQFNYTYWFPVPVPVQWWFNFWGWEQTLGWRAGPPAEKWLNNGPV